MTEPLLLAAGAGQELLALASLAVPRVLGWSTELRALTPLTRQVFWTYGAYVWGAHVAFGALTLAHAEWFLAGSPPARAVAGFISLWWGARLAIALFGRERAELPRRPSVRAAHGVLLLCFCALTAVYLVVSLGGGR
jgi:hypothetical protein